MSLLCRTAGWPLCATQQRAEAASKCGPWKRSTHTGPEPRVSGAGAAWPLSLHSGPLKGVKSLWLIITIICKCASCSRAEDAFDLWCCKSLQLLCRLRWGDVKRCLLPSAYTHNTHKIWFRLSYPSGPRATPHPLRAYALSYCCPKASHVCIYSINLYKKRKNLFKIF